MFVSIGNAALLIGNAALLIGNAALLIGVSVSTLRRWESEKRFVPSQRTLGGHRRYEYNQIQSITNGVQENLNNPSHAICYARVSSHDQKKDLETQKDKLSRYADQHFDRYELISDLGSGLNFRKSGLKKLITRIHLGDFTHLVLNHKDRLLRFGSEILFTLCQLKGIQVTILEAKEEQSFEMKLSSDMIELVTVFSTRLYGKRSHQNRRKLAA